jgi:hypothetical protein
VGGSPSGVKIIVVEEDREVKEELFAQAQALLNPICNALFAER